MIKLTPEQIERILDENFGFANVKEAMLFMQDEVLRLNGITDKWSPIETVPKDGTEILIGKYYVDEVNEYFGESRWLWILQGSFEGDLFFNKFTDDEDKLSTDGSYRTATHWTYPPQSPRATGCPDTMDDTGHFAEVDMPAFLRKQAG